MEFSFYLFHVIVILLRILMTPNTILNLNTNAETNTKTNTYHENDGNCNKCN